jgi:hypothetical protein
MCGVGRYTMQQCLAHVDLHRHLHCSAHICDAYACIPVVMLHLCLAVVLEVDSSLHSCYAGSTLYLCNDSSSSSSTNSGARAELVYGLKSKKTCTM